MIATQRGGLQLHFRMTPIVVKPGEMFAVNLLDPVPWSSWQVKPGRGTVSFPKEQAVRTGNVLSAGDTVSECLYFQIITSREVHNVWLRKGVARVTTLPSAGAADPPLMFAAINIVRWSWP